MKENTTQAEKFSKDWRQFLESKTYAELKKQYGILKFLPHAIQEVLKNYPDAKMKKYITFSDGSRGALTKNGFESI